MKLHTVTPILHSNTINVTVRILCFTESLTFTDQ